jgi:hypothetical protein
MAGLARWLQLTFKFGVPALLLWFVSASLYEYLHPWPAADAALPVGPNQIRVLVGFYIDADDTRSDVELDYALLPDAMTQPTLYTLSQENGGPVEVIVSPYGLVIPFLVIVGLLVGCVIAWLKPRWASPNNALEQTRDG